MAIRALLGRKIGMTQYFKETGEAIPVTAIELGPCTVLQVKTAAGRDGYNALRLGFGERKEKSLTKPELGQFKKINQKPAEFVREIPWDGQGEVKVGDRLTCELFEGVQYVHVTGTTKGKGFMGVVKRWHFSGLPATHGQTDRERHPGAIGRNGSISRDLWRGKRMAGHMGNQRQTIRNLELIKVLKEQNAILVHGPVPGPVNGLVVVSASSKVRKQPKVSEKKGKKVEVVKKKQA